MIFINTLLMLDGKQQKNILSSKNHSYHMSKSNTMINNEFEQH